jgi:uncharacterized protein YjbJ (UPF0337 family)
LKVIVVGDEGLDLRGAAYHPMTQGKIERPFPPVHSCSPSNPRHQRRKQVAQRALVLERQARIERAEPPLTIADGNQFIPQSRYCARLTFRAAKSTSMDFARNSPTNKWEDAMNWDHISDNWKHFSASVKEKWAKLTDEEIAEIKGKRAQLEAKIQKAYGHAKDQVTKDVDEWISKLKKRK